jgi:hypothetical protein
MKEDQKNGITTKILEQAEVLVDVVPPVRLVVALLSMAMARGSTMPEKVT